MTVANNNITLWLYGETMSAIPINDQVLEEGSRIFGSLGDVSRLKLLRALLDAHEPLSQGALAERTGLSQANASKHLAFLGQVGLVTREPRGNLVFFLPVTLLVLCFAFLWKWSPSWLDPRINSLFMLIDPAGARWLDETYLTVDRGVDFYNHQRIRFDALLIANRLLFALMGLAAVAFSARRFARTLRT